MRLRRRPRSPCPPAPAATARGTSSRTQSGAGRSATPRPVWRGSSARLRGRGLLLGGRGVGDAAEAELAERVVGGDHRLPGRARVGADQHRALAVVAGDFHDRLLERLDVRSEEHTSELQSLMRTSYAVLCLKNKTPPKKKTTP